MSRSPFVASERGATMHLPAGACNRNVGLRRLRLWRTMLISLSHEETDECVALPSNKIGAELLKPHRAYWPLLKNILDRGWVSSIAHITGGGGARNST